MGWQEDWQSALNSVMGILGGTQPADPMQQYLHNQGINLQTGAPVSPQSASAGQSPGVLSVLNQLLPLLLSGSQAYSASQYGGSQLQAMQDIYNMQKQAARQALAVRPGQLGVEAARMAQPLNKQLAYQLLSNAAGENELSGMTQSPGATAAGQAKYLVPAEQQNLGIGATLAQAAYGQPLDVMSGLSRLSAPNYMGALGGASQLGASSAIPPYLQEGGLLGGLGGLLGTLGAFPGVR